MVEMVQSQFSVELTMNISSELSQEPEFSEDLWAVLDLGQQNS